MEDFKNMISLTDEDGEEVEFEFLDLIKLEGEEFVVLLPLDESDNGGEVVILRLESTDDEGLDAYVSVEDDALLGRVFDVFKQRFADEFDFED